ncbi:uncharacterized protein LOC8275461 [Ricinus communis]|uniref:uncharacterized protein LOC8275461 n=1 Tax=Ricinus communis TaxID=3988 RepID=UPI00077278BB|nr:uncharacterized protein LOC8275461 [Ricinus communis]|eukprot:XP_015579669.1 uncharacterized protein LOC8275461 [Ricinus communis]
MVALCFVLDLCSLSPSLLRDLKQCLLQLGNSYAISPPSSRHRFDSLGDRIGLCYIFKNRISSSRELKIAYHPRGNFHLRDFHDAVNNLPTDAFLPEIDDSGALRRSDAKLSSVLSDQVVYSWEIKDFMRKVIVLSSCLPENIDSALKITLMDAADKCVSVEFLLFELSSSYFSNMQENINCFLTSLSDLDNCSFQTYIPDSRLFHSLTKRWLQDLEDDIDEPLQACFIFQTNLVGSLNHISCSLSISVRQIIDEFSACQTCRCHGVLLDHAAKDKLERLSCPVTGHDLGTADVVDNSVKVGDKTILFMPSFQSSMKVHQLSSPIEFNIIERTNLKSLNEGVIFGTPYFVAPSACNEVETSSDEMSQPELNSQLFQGICNYLHSMDEGLVCSSYCNVDTMKGTAFPCYYILLPSDNGPMLLRRLASLEEVLPMLEVNQFIDSSMSKDIQNTIQTSLLKIDLRDYNPVLHERGLHRKLNLLIKESFQFVTVTPKLNEATSGLNSNQLNSLEQSNCITVVKDEAPQLKMKVGEDKTSYSIAEEWEQLVVSEVPNLYSPTPVSKAKVDMLVLSSPDTNKQLDVKTSRILERLEVPKQLKTKVTSPIFTSSSFSETGAPIKKPPVPFQPSNATDQSLTSSQLMKPNFQRLKRKHK